MEGLTVSAGDAEVIIDVSSGDVDVLEDSTGDSLQEDYTGSSDPVTLVDNSELVAAVQSLEGSLEQSTIAVCIILGFIAGSVLFKGFFIGKD